MTTCNVVPVTTWLAVGETIVTIAGDDGREPAGVGAARLATSDGAAVKPPEPDEVQAATASTRTARPSAGHRRKMRCGFCSLVKMCLTG
jgi:hypothetical protein